MSLLHCRPHRFVPLVVAAALMTSVLAHAQTPGVVTTIATTGPIVGEKVTLVWGGVPGADAFVVRLSDSTGAVVDVRVGPDEAGCADTSICRTTVNIAALQPGTVQWFVQAVQGDAAGPWSRAQQFVSARVSADGSVLLAGKTDSSSATRLSETGVNTAVGVAALASGGGVYNTAVGNSALELNQGNYNTAVGMNVLASNTSGTWNTAAGMGALRRNTTGHQNVAMGGQALAANQSGTANTAVGTNALGSYQDSNGTAIGANALANSLGLYNTAVGVNALTGAVGANGQANTALGVDALFANESGNYNVAAGQSALASNTSGWWNTGLGTSALRRNTTGAVNVAVGAQALFSNTTGEGNTGVGVNSLITSTSGRYNTAVGFATLYSNTTGYQNTAVGYGAVSSNTTGAFNVGIGTNALAANVSGVDNVAIGTSALGQATGSLNVAIGSSAGYNLRTGSSNVYLAHAGVDGENQTMRLGNAEIIRTFITGVRGVTTVQNDAVTVLIDSNGQLGTVSSSARYKEDINDMGTASSGIFRLRPVTFRYRQSFSNGERPLQFGLIAEQVAEAMPSLAVYNADGAPETVKYHELPTLLLNEVQRLERETRTQANLIDTLEQLLERDKRAHADRVNTLERELKEMRAIIDALTVAKR